MSDSEKLRQQGNIYYKNAFTTGLSSAVKKCRLENAMSFYQKALNCANGNNENVASASKNYAKCAHLMAGLYREDYGNELDKVIYYYKETFQYFNKAVTFGDICKSREWVQDILSSYCTSFNDLIETCEELPRKERVIILESAAAGMDNQHYYHDCMLEISNIWLKEAVSALSCKKDFKSSLYALKEMYRPIEILKASGNMRPDISEHALALEADMVMQMAHTESLLAIHKADSMLESHLKESETIDMDYIFTVIDEYKAAIILTREIEIEVEARALSQLGRLYDTVLKNKSRATLCFKRSIELSHTLRPRLFHTELWFKTATETLRRYQEETVQHQQKQHEEERAEYLKELGDEMKILKDGRSLKDGKLLLYVVENLPPKRKLIVPSEDDVLRMGTKELKKLFLKALAAYHPDKQDVEAYGMKWKVLCDEITKALTSVYECHKSCS